MRVHRRQRNFKRPKDFTRINHRIKAKTLRLIDEEGSLIGIVDLRKALDLARNSGLDLIEISPNANPPVCRIYDYGKFKYQQKKKQHEAKKKQQIVLVKEIQLSPKTEEHDIKFKIRHIERFLNDKNKVKVRIKFRGREMAHKNLGFKLMDRICKEIAEIGSVDVPPKMEGPNMLMIIVPKVEK